MLHAFFDLLRIEIAATLHGDQRFHSQNFFGLLAHRGQLLLIIAILHHFGSHDQLVLFIYSRLYVVACHRAGAFVQQTRILNHLCYLAFPTRFQLVQLCLALCLPLAQSRQFLAQLGIGRVGGTLLLIRLFQRLQVSQDVGLDVP